MASKLQQQVTQCLAEAYNLLANSTLNVQGKALSRAGQTMDRFHEIINALNGESLVVSEAELDLKALEHCGEVVESTDDGISGSGR